MTTAEKKRLLGYKPSSTRPEAVEIKTVNIPKEVNWETAGAVDAVQN